ncbi:MAG: DUF58 domain-containing protein [Pseudomonadota bacterium]|nr:DUF58 domain-containing protein [Pseudomonadota bacterium]
MIQPSARAFWLWGAVTLLFVAAWLVPSLAWVALGLDAAIAVLVLLDGRDARRRPMELVRTLAPTVYQGEPTVLTVAVTNPSARPLRVRVREVLPAALSDESVELLLTVPPMSTITQPVTLVPRVRERVVLTTAAVRLAGRWGLAWAERRLGAPVAVKVYPKVHHEGETGMVLRQALERRDGAHARNLHGPSTEVASLRDYQPGDDFRTVQWKATARRGKPVTAERTWEQRQRLAILLDIGRPMAGTDGVWTRFDHALAAAIALSRVASTWGDEVTIVLFSRTIRRVVRTGGRTRDFAAVFEALHREQADTLEPDWDALVRWCAVGLPRRTLAVVCTSVVDPGTADRLTGSLIALARRHRPLLVNLADPAVAQNARAVPSDALGAFAKVTAMGIEEDIRALEVRLRGAGVATVTTPADRLTLGMLRGWMELKAKRGG